MWIDAALATLSSAVGLAALAGSFAQRAAHRQENEVAADLKAALGPDLSDDADPRDLNRYLVGQLGALSIREYADDADARRVVGRAVSRVDDLLENIDGPTVGGSGGFGHFDAAQRALQRHDPIGALARLRLGIELEMRHLADINGVPTGRPAGLSRLLQSLNRLGVLTDQEAARLTHAIRVANGALHGETVDDAVATEAVINASRALDSLRSRTRADHSA